MVISGSTNFSDASTKDNDENMLVIRGDKRVADIYLGEFMRLWRHYRFRYDPGLERPVLQGRHGEVQEADDVRRAESRGRHGIGRARRAWCDG